MSLARRDLLGSGLGLLLVSTAPPLRAADRDLAEAIRSWAAGAVPKAGKVEIEIAELVENGNAVPITVRVSGSMAGAEAVREIAVFNERNPQRDVIRVQFTRFSPKAEFSTRIRLATSQRIVALARLADGSIWQREVDVLVTLAACVEG